MIAESMARLYRLLTGLGIKGTHQAYPKGGAPAPPFFVYDLDSGGEVFADGSNWCETPRYRVQLLERQMDADLEQRLSNALRDEYGPVLVMEDWVESEHSRIVSYYFTDTHPERG